MINQQLLDYIKGQLEQGVSREAISKALLSKNWQQSDIDEAFAKLNTQSSAEKVAVTKQVSSDGSIKTGGDKGNQAIIGLIFGLFGLIAWLIPLFGLPVTVIGLIFSLIGLKSVKRGIAIAGVILSVIGLVLTIINASIGAYMGATGQHAIVNEIFDEGDSDKPSESDPQPNDSGKANLINQGVRHVKSQYDLPYKVDPYTTMVDVTAEQDAIRYHYVLSGVDPAKVTNDMLKQGLVANLCPSRDVRELLDQDINMEYSYSVDNSTKTFFVTITKADCQ